MTSNREAAAAEIRAAIARAGVEKAEVARRAGLSRQTLHRKLSVQTGFLLEEVAAIAAAIDADPRGLASAAVAPIVITQ